MQPNLHSRCALRLQRLDDLRGTHLQLSTENPVPEAAGDTEAILVVSKVVLEMVLLELLVPRGKLLVVEEVVGEIVECVAEDTAAVSCGRRVPVVKEDSVRKLPKRRRKRCEQCGRHNQPVFVHRQVVVNTMKEEM